MEQSLSLRSDKSCREGVLYLLSLQSTHHHCFLIAPFHFQSVCEQHGASILGITCLRHSSVCKFLISVALGKIMYLLEYHFPHLKNRQNNSSPHLSQCEGSQCYFMGKCQAPWVFQRNPCNLRWQESTSNSSSRNAMIARVIHSANQRDICNYPVAIAIVELSAPFEIESPAFLKDPDLR